MGFTIPPPAPIKEICRFRELERAESIINEKDNKLKKDIDDAYNETVKKNSLINIYGK